MLKQDSIDFSGQFTEASAFIQAARNREEFAILTQGRSRTRLNEYGEKRYCELNALMTSPDQPKWYLDLIDSFSI